jgi:hypothetical protein
MIVVFFPKVIDPFFGADAICKKFYAFYKKMFKVKKKVIFV